MFAWKHTETAIGTLDGGNRPELPAVKLLLTETLALVRGPIHEYFGGNDVPKRKKHLHQFIIPKLLRKVIDEEVAAFWA